MDENKKRELNEEMSLDDLHETVGGTKGHCGFTDETGHCGFTCEDDGSYQISGPGCKIHCPRCWSRDINIRSWAVEEFNQGDSNWVICNHCGHGWTTTAH